jgi:hypothetical protein
MGRHGLIALAERDRWLEALRDVPHGPAHTWGICRAAALTSGLATFLFVFEDGDGRAVCPVSERDFGGRTDVVTPYGFGGFAGTVPRERLAEGWAAFARSRGWVCGYLGLNPVFHDGGGFAPGEVHVHNRLYVMDLRGTDAELWARLSQNRRRQLRDWASVERGLVHDRGALTAFLLAEYPAFFARRGVGPASDFSAQTMAAFAGLDDVWMVGAAPGGDVESVAVFAHTPHAADYLFGVSVPGAEHHSAHLIWAGAQRLRRLGVPSLNLGGGVREGDRLAEFKRRFGAAQLPLRSLRQVYDAEAYAELCRRAGVSPDRGGWFPPYRATAPAARAAP